MSRLTGRQSGALVKWGASAIFALTLYVQVRRGAAQGS